VRRAASSGLRPLTDRNEWGQFFGCVRVEWQADGREMRLLEDFVYRDQHDTDWDAPTGADVDGASIPQFLWASVGSPYTGKYRLASVVHDIACCRKERPWRDVHRMFYHACRCAHVPAMRAKLMFAAVYAFGPKWPEDEQRAFPSFTPRQFDALCEWIEATDPPIEAIEDRLFVTGRELDCFKERR
jgi:hypothetical protein